jgi:hypothetical protein
MPKGVNRVLRRRTVERQDLGSFDSLVMDAADRGSKGTSMAEEEPLLVSPPTQEVAVHVRDYGRFTRMLKWSALTVLVIAFIVLLILK